nr:amidoligase family protein [Oceanicoccus sp. KOV_DT_Chl]
MILSAVSGTVKTQTVAETLISSRYGEFKVEVDWSYLKREARLHADTKPHLDLLSKAATLLVPIEVVCPHRHQPTQHT